ncbi:MAG TPA: TlpA family protein disulfide reductase, partial [Myxococcota bacterium]|nr:TlpA family protein disulfide reductase [Myxococcota bacterium]
VLGIGLEDKPEAVKEFAKAYDMDYPVFLARDKALPLMQALGNTRGALPYTVVIDAEGRMLSKKLGVLKKPDLDAAAAALLAK